MFLRLLKIINWFLTTKPSAPIVIEATPKDIIMETQIEPIVQVRDWAIERIRTAEDYDTARAIAGEFEEWLDLEGQDEISYICLEDDSTFGDQEIDVR
jgi:hypothetical protein